MVEKIDEVLTFWFGQIEEGFTACDRSALWWGGSAENDRLIADLFGHKVSQALRGELDNWSETPRGRLALIILLDQFTRTIYRGTADAFAGDPHALKLCQEGRRAGHDQALEFVERTFFYMPLEHAEDLDCQVQCIDCFEQMLLEVPGGKKIQVEGWLDFAFQHQEQIQQFGRFPHRNEVLGRSSTPEELAYLLQSRNRWGQ
ncbi:DUF924 family protein [uncultured Neptuniibacter sp.]|uniref:DUF924 family protein n=1 Tax=uncultured Neptuniibacter sp. TaxID=502143 RepID=UPI00262270D0|nr:DUF924 family protein [uncultured Neptuniibacter sp.]